MKEFFDKHIDIIKSKSLKCQNCGAPLVGHYSEVAHILPKNKFKSICQNDKNVVYLCSYLTGNNCHGNFDNSSNEYFRKMKVFPLANERYEELKEVLTESINYKIEDRYGN